MLMRREWLMVVVVKEECGRTMGMEAVGGVCCGVRDLLEGERGDRAERGVQRLGKQGVG